MRNFFVTADMDMRNLYRGRRRNPLFAYCIFFRTVVVFRQTSRLNRPNYLHNYELTIQILSVRSVRNDKKKKKKLIVSIKSRKWVLKRAGYVTNGCVCICIFIFFFVVYAHNSDLFPQPYTTLFTFN